MEACIDRLKAEILLEALREAGGVRTVAAKRLQMPRRTFFHQLKQFALVRRDADDAGTASDD
jgi:transcriptional regulator of acetoin/glycerol metabolism